MFGSRLQGPLRLFGSSVVNGCVVRALTPGDQPCQRVQVWGVEYGSRQVSMTTKHGS